MSILRKNSISSTFSVFSRHLGGSKLQIWLFVPKIAMLGLKSLGIVWKVWIYVQTSIRRPKLLKKGSKSPNAGAAPRRFGELDQKRGFWLEKTKKYMFHLFRVIFRVDSENRIGEAQFLLGILRHFDPGSGSWPYLLWRSFLQYPHTNDYESQDSWVHWVRGVAFTQQKI